jgi:ferritin-like metal-binding protein YciE
MKNMNELSLSFLQEIYYAERQLLKALPKMAKVAQNEKLKQGFMDHHNEIESHVERLQQVFEHLGKRTRGQVCEAINGIIEEAEELIHDFDSGAVLDAALAANAQAMEHYQMARYGSLIGWLKATGHANAVKLLEETLQDETKADRLLNQIASSELNQKAAATAKVA